MEQTALGAAKHFSHYGAADEGGGVRPAPIGKNSALLTAGIVVADVVGSGILSMATAVRMLGWLAGLVAMLLFFGMNAHVFIMLWRVHALHPHARTIAELTASVLAELPSGQRDLAVAAVGTAQSIFLFLVLGLYSLSIGESLGKLLYDFWLCLPQWTLIGSCLLLPILASATSLGAYKSLVWVNCATILGTIFLPFAHVALSDAGVGTQHVVHAVQPDLQISHVFRALCIFAFAFCGQFILVEIMTEMRDHREFPKAYLWYSAPFQLAAFLLTGVGGYCLVGDSAHGIIVDTIGFGPAFRLAGACLLAHMMVTYLIKGFVFCKGLTRSLEGAESEQPDREWRRWVAVVCVTVASTWFMAQLVPFFNDLVDLLGASLTPFACWMVPIGVYVYSMQHTKAQGAGIGPLEWAVIAVELAVSAALMVAGTGITVSHILQQWHRYGGPFDCHCENLWNSCECSAAQLDADQCGAEQRAAHLLVLSQRTWAS